MPSNTRCFALSFAALVIAAAPTCALAQDDAIRGNGESVVIDSSRVESVTASATAYCLRWRARPQLIESNGNYVTYRCVKVAY